MTKLINGTIYSIARDPDGNTGANLLRLRVLDSADDATLFSTQLSAAKGANGDALPISKRHLSDAGLPPELMDCPADEFDALAATILDQPVTLRVTDKMVPKKEKGVVVGERPGYDANLEPVSRIRHSV